MSILDYALPSHRHRVPPAHALSDNRCGLTKPRADGRRTAEQVCTPFPSCTLHGQRGKCAIARESVKRRLADADCTCLNCDSGEGDPLRWGTSLRRMEGSWQPAGVGRSSVVRAVKFTMRYPAMTRLTGHHLRGCSRKGEPGRHVPVGCAGGQPGAATLAGRADWPAPETPGFDREARMPPCSNANRRP
jgi:hypothetical protein